MKDRRDESLTVGLETSRRYEVMEMHLFDENEARERALCGADASTDDLRGVNGYLEDRLYGNPVGAVCEGCKSRAAPFAVKTGRDLEDEGLPDEAEEYRELARMLWKETGPKPSGR